MVQVHPRDRNNTSRTWPRPGVRDGRGSRITLSLLGSQPGVLARWSGRIVRPSAPDSKSGERFIPFRGFKSHSLRKTSLLVRGGFSKLLPIPASLSSVSLSASSRCCSLSALSSSCSRLLPQPDWT